MRTRHRTTAIFAALAVAILLTAAPASAQKRGGTLRLYHNDTPPSASLLEEATISTVAPFSAVFNNLVTFNNALPHESIDTIVGDLAESWSWDQTNTRLTFKLRHGVKWHDGTPFTAKDVQCTWRMLIGASEGQDFRKNPRKVWYGKLKDVTTSGDDEATFVLSEPQPSLLVLLASGFSAVFPCHVPQQVMRTRPIGTGPFKLADYRRGESIRLVRNPDYFKPGRPYLDEIDWKVIDSRSTRLLAFETGEFDMTFVNDVTIPLIAEVKAHDPKAICQTQPSGTLGNLLLNRVNPPFDNADARKAMSLALDRDEFSKIFTQGQALIGGAMLPKPVGEWGMPVDRLMKLTGYNGDTAGNLAEAKTIMQKLGYTEQNPLKIKIQTRNLPAYRDPSVVLIDQLKKIGIDGELEVVDTTQWYARLIRRDYTIGFNVTGVSVDDPDANLIENYACKSERNYTQYCSPEVDRLLAAQSRELDRQKRREMVWDIEKLLVEDAARPVIDFGVAADCWQPYVKGFVPHDNSQYNNLRFEDVWLDK